MFVESAESLATAVALDSKKIAARMMMIHMRQHACMWDGFEASCKEMIQHALELPEDGSTHSEGAVFTLTAVEHPPEVMKLVAKQVAMTQAAGIAPMPERQMTWTRDGAQKLHIGLVSNDFYNHATAVLLVNVLENLDRSKLEITLYSHGQVDNSQLSHRLIKSCDRFIDMTAISTFQMAQQIYKDKVDILLDLKGHTNGNRMSLFAYRSAPIQVTYLGFPGTTGAPYMDYIIGDQWVTPLDDAPYYSECIAQLPNSYQPNDSTREHPVAETRAQWGLPAHAKVLGCFNQAFKLTPETFHVWMSILQKVPDAVLWMLYDNEQATRNICIESRKYGIDPERIYFTPKKEQTRHLGRLPVADLILDNWPCNAHTTASDALWMGVPIVTVTGQSFASRVAGSLLHAVSLDELICKTPQDYENKVIELLNNPSKLQSIRQHLQDGRAHFPLFDSVRYARNFQQLLMRMADRAVRGQKPAALPVQPD